MIDDMWIRELDGSFHADARAVWESCVTYQQKRIGARVVYAFGEGPSTSHAPARWQSHCGVIGIFTKYQEEYRVLGNAKWRTYVTADRYSEFRDKSYEENALEVSRALIGLYER